MPGDENNPAEQGQMVTRPTEEFKDHLSSVLQDQMARQRLEQAAPGLLSIQDQQTSYYVQSQMTQDEQEKNYHKKHMENSHIKSIREAVQHEMPNAYTNVDQIRSQPREDKRKTRLHQGRGRTLRDETGQPVLKLDIAGSSFSQFRAEHKGFHGKNTVLVRGNHYKVDQDIEGKLKSEIKERWYHRSRLAGFIKSIRTPEQIREENEKIRAENELIRQEFEVQKQKYQEYYGNSVGYGKKDYKHMRRSVKEGLGTRITLAGPLALRGMSNRGDYSIENLREHILAASADYLTNIFSQWNSAEDEHMVPLVIRGHSRGGVAALEGAMRVKAWVHEVFPNYEKFVKFELTQYDPVPGTGSESGVHKEVDIAGDREYKADKATMRALGDSVESTVVYSMHSDHSVFFTPQTVLGAKRLILMPSTHSVGLDTIDEQKTGKGGEVAKEKNRAGYTDARTGDVYMSSAVNEMDEGVYIADEHNTLVRMDSYAAVERVMGQALENAKGQSDRHKVVLKAAKCWFDRADARAASAGNDAEG